MEGFPPELDRAIDELIPSKDPLDAASFNPVEYINRLFPTEQSLVDVDLAVSRLKMKRARTMELLSREVREQSKMGEKGKVDLVEAQGSITELFSKINEIKTKATESEAMVQEICRDIKKLDYAKQHLLSTLTALQRLHMLVTSVERIQVHMDRKQYREVGNLLEAINEFGTHFEKYSAVPKVAALNDQVEDIKRQLSEQIYAEFKKIDAGTAGDVSLSAMNLSDACFVIDALGEAAKNDFMVWFCDQRLADYVDSFGPGKKLNKLEFTERRYVWLKKELGYYDERYGKIFPMSWNMDEYMCIKFCQLTREHLSNILDDAVSEGGSTDALTVDTLVTNVRKTLEFEEGMRKRFSSRTAPMYQAVVAPASMTGDEANKLSYLDEKAEDDMLEEELNPNSAEAVKRRMMRFRQRQEEMKQAKQFEMQKVQEKRLTFVKVVSACFDPYMDIYIAQLDRSVRSEMDKILGMETWDTTDDPNDEDASLILNSSTELVYTFNVVMKQCHSLTQAVPMYNLYKLFKTYLSDYAKVLERKLPSMVDLCQQQVKFTPRLERMVLLIVNTAAYFSDVTENMKDKFVSLIDEAFKSSIDTAEQKSQFEGLLVKGTKVLVAGLEGRIRPALTALEKTDWSELTMVGDQSHYASQIVLVLAEASPMYKLWLQAMHYSFFCDSFVDSFIPRFLESIFKCKHVSEIGAEQLLLDVVSIKNVLEKLPNQDGPVSKRFAKRVNKGIDKIIGILKVLMAPSETLVESFRTLVHDGKKADFNRILELKGVKKEDGSLFSSLVDGYGRIKGKGLRRK